MKIPIEIFDEALNQAVDSNVNARAVMDTQAEIKLQNSNFTIFIQKLLLRLRRKMWLKEGRCSEGTYAVTQELLQTLRLLA